MSSGASRAANKHAKEPETQDAYPDTAAALRDLARFIEGQEHMEDVPLLMQEVVDDLNRVLDNELLQSMETMYEWACYSDEAASSGLRELVPAFLLLKQLRDLQKTRMRDALKRAVAKGLN